MKKTNILNEVKWFKTLDFLPQINGNFYFWWRKGTVSETNPQS